MKNGKRKRITVYLDEEEYQTFRFILLIKHLTLSEWIRSEIKKAIEKGNES